MSAHRRKANMRLLRLSTVAVMLAGFVTSGVAAQPAELPPDAASPAATEAASQANSNADAAATPSQAETKGAGIEASAASAPSQADASASEGTASAVAASTRTPPVEDVDVSAYVDSTGADAASATTWLSIHGFSDFTFTKLMVDKDSAWSGVFVPYSTFAIGNLNVYFDANLSPMWHALSEIRFTYLPNGVETQNNDGTITRTNTAVTDYSQARSLRRWGGISIERAWLEFAPSEKLAIRAGQWLTRYGIWNVDHGSPTIIAVQRPFAIGQNLFPESQTGLDVYGKFYVGAVDLGYHLTLSNGRGPIDTYQDMDDNKALGGRISLHTDVVGSLDVGASIYHGTYTDRAGKADFVPTPMGANLYVHRDVITQYDETALGLDIRWTSGAFIAQAEFVAAETIFTEAGRPYSALFGFSPDYRRLGAYALVGYRTPWFGIMPFGLLEYYNFAEDPLSSPAYGVTVGFNIRPMASTVLKLQYLSVFQVPDSRGPGLIDEPLRVFEAQVAWAF